MKQLRKRMRFWRVLVGFVWTLVLTMGPSIETSRGVKIGRRRAMQIGRDFSDSIVR